MTIKTIRNNKKILLITVISFVVILTLILTTSLAKYKVTQSIKIVSGTINYSPSDFSLMGIYIESDNGYVSTDTVPESGYEFNSDESYCKIGDTVQDVTISYDFDTKALSITPISNKGMKCFLYFDEYKPLAKDIILANKTISTRTNFSTTLTTNTTGTIYAATDDDGTSYYYAGAPTDNYVKFAGYYWRIIRINGDNTIRMIYDGTSVRNNGTSSSATNPLILKFNSNVDNVGYMYTAGVLHGFGTNSTIKTEIDTWYVNNLLNYSNYIDTNAGFCGDRTAYLDSNGTTFGEGTNITYYASYVRLITNKKPALTCTNGYDLYTPIGSNKGNKALKYPVGLISADEIVYAGGVYNKSNTGYYLYTGQFYYSMSPSYLYSSALIFYVYSDGMIMDGGVNFTGIAFGGRPVINLRADVTLTGSGTSGAPYLVS